MRMPWLDSLNLGIDGFDDDHRHMFELLNELNANVACGNLPGVRVLFDELYSAALEHFRAEEKVMARMAYPAAPAHMAEHDHARSTLMALHGHVNAGRLHQAEHLLTEYTARYFRGVLRDDTLLARFLSGQA